ncbi:MAG: aminopeptidase P family protein [Nitrososphaerota archaeon]|nr:aminopeptidase P family protein [Nitrososphaerota archaeon]MDG6923209.1 aminopeptidase P family protein [Nitrososphaerota archaeon]
MQSITNVSLSNVDARNYKWVVPKSHYSHPSFSDGEFRRRWKLVRDWMKQKGLSCLVVGGGHQIWDRGWFNIMYLTNYSGTLSPYSYLVFPLEGDPMIVDSRNCAERPDRRSAAIIDDIRWGRYDEEVVKRIKELRLDHDHVGVVEITTESRIPWSHYETFKKELPNCKFDFVTEEFNNLRMQKSPEEISALERSAELGDMCIEALAERVRPGTTESEVFAIVYDTMIRNEGQPESMILISTMSMSEPDCNMCRMKPIHRTLKRGDVIITEIGPRDPHGYEAQTGKPITLGPPTKEFQSMYDACFEAYNRVEKVLRPGATDEEIRKAASVVIERGFHWDTPIFHGIAPVGPHMSFKSGSKPMKEPLKPYVGITLETNACRKDLTAGVTLDDTFITTESGVRRLNKYPVQITEI